MKIHLVGIGGEGMAGLARLALLQGHNVTGSELRDSINCHEVERAGALVYHRHSPEHVAGADLVVRSSAIPNSHVEVAAARERGIRVLKRSECLSLLLVEAGKQTVAVAGTCGKSSTTQMLGAILSTAGLDPLGVVGSYVSELAGHVRVGSGRFAVVEACEHDRSFLDLSAQFAIITNVAAEHLDYYKGGIDEIVAAFSEFATRVTDAGGTVVTSSDDPVVSGMMLPRLKGDIRTFGLTTGEWRAEKVQQSQSLPLASDSSYRSTFVVNRAGAYYGTFPLLVPGTWALRNALGAVVMAECLGVDTAAISEGLGTYAGIPRRFEAIPFDGGRHVAIYDYGHHLMAFDAVIRTARDQYPNARLVSVICLRQYHRTARHLQEFAGVFSHSDRCIVAPILAGLGDDESSIRAVSPTDLARSISALGCPTEACATESETLERVTAAVENAGQDQLVLLLIGSGEAGYILKAIQSRR